MDTDDAHRSFINLLSKISVGRGGVGAGGTGSVVLSSSRPAPYVPEDLVAQAQSVLQGNLLIFFNSLNTNRYLMKFCPYCTTLIYTSPP